MARIRKTSINTKKEKIKFYLFKYKRLSKEDINSGQSKSIKSQDMVINAYIQRLLDNDEDITIVDEYIDDGVSGMYDTRENWQKMITCIEQTQVTKSEQIIVIVSDLSRGFRNSSDQQYYLENYFLEKNIRFISCELPQLDTLYEPEKIYNLEVQFHGMMNAQYAKDLSTKIKSRLKERRKKGEFVGSFAPYGYKKSQEDNHVLVIDEEVADNIKNIFSWFISGISMRKICERLNELGVINPTSYRKQKGSKYFNPHAENNSALWHAGTIRNILQSEYYIGNLDQHHTETRITPTGKKRINISDDSQIAVNTHDSIIDTDTFNKAQHLLQLDMRFPNNERKHYLFSGFLKCGDCKKAMVRTTVKNEHIYYYCSTYRKLSKNHCTKHTIREDVLNDLVLKAIQAHISIAVSLSDQVNLINVSGVINNASERIESLLKSNQDILAKENSLIDIQYLDWKSGEITREQYKRLIKASEEKVEHINNSITKLLEEKRKLETNISNNNIYLETFTKHNNITILDRNVLIELVKKINIYEDKAIDIVFNFEDEYKLTLEFIESNLSDENTQKLQLRKTF